LTILAILRNGHGEHRGRSFHSGATMAIPESKHLSHVRARAGRRSVVNIRSVEIYSRVHYLLNPALTC
jgi:hypothetical protein